MPSSCRVSLLVGDAHQIDLVLPAAVPLSALTDSTLGAVNRLLRSKGVDTIEKIRIDTDPQLRSEMMEKTGRRTVPQIYIDDFHVGGCDDLHALDREGKLDPLLQA